MNKIKYILIALIAFVLLTGCSANANITINYDGSVNENIDVINSNDEIIYGNKSIEESIQLYFNKYETALEVSDYNYDIHTSNDVSGANIYRDYDGVCSFVNNTIFSQYLYSNITCTENDSYYVIQSNGNVIKNTDRYDSWLAPDDVTLKISLPVSATEQNADEINGTTYIWKYDENTNDDKSFYLRISKSALEESEQRYNEEQENKKNRNTIITICVIAGIVIALGLIIIVLYKKHKKNKIDY